MPSASVALIRRHRFDLSIQAVLPCCSVAFASPFASPFASSFASSFASFHRPFIPLEILMKILKTTLPVVLLSLGLLGASAAQAHGTAKARHGGIVQMANDLQFELVVEADGASVYLYDHDKPLASKEVSGKLSVLQGTQKIEAELRPSSENRLKATGLKLAKGDKVVAVLNTLNGKTTTVRFTVR
jgi:hypothetical protein